jgi:hypothetical protein
MFKFKITSHQGLKKALLIAVPVFVGALVFAMQSSTLYTGSKQQTPKKIAKEKIAYDEALLRKFAAFTRQMESIKDYSCTGSITARDEADTAEVIQNIAFEIYNDGERYYYRLGDNEMILKPGMSVNIDHQAKKILLSSGQRIEKGNSFHIMDVKQVVKLFESEQYLIKSGLNGSIETLSLLNPNHASCKEYSVSIDTVNNMPVRFYTRLTNLDDPLRTDNEKVIDIRIKKWGNTALIEKYTSTATKLLKLNGQWKAIGDYAGYEIIQ